jgi:hypothetical protein
MHRVGAARRLADIARDRGAQTTLFDCGIGRWTAVNPTGNPGLATAGSGRRAPGIIGALLAHKESAWLPATAGVFVRRLAGDQVAADRGQTLVAGDVAEGRGFRCRGARDGDASASSLQGTTTASAGDQEVASGLSRDFVSGEVITPPR